MTDRNYLKILALLFVFLKAEMAAAQFGLHPLIADDMVLQRGTNVRIWGWHKVGGRVHLSIDKKKYQTKADKDGNWEIALDPFKAGGPYQMKIWTSDTTISLNNILFGDVWLCSGQSNMEFALNKSEGSHDEIKTAKYSNIRHFKVDRLSSKTPQERIPDSPWTICTPETAGDFTAVGYYFAKEISENINVPIGLINSTWGGSSIESWMSQQAHAIQYMDVYFDSLKLLNNRLEQELIDKVGPAKVLKRDEKLVVKELSVLSYDDSNWIAHDVPQTWEKAGFERLNGVVYYRKEFTIDFEPDQTSILSLGKIDNTDITWVNGVEVGRNNYYHYNPRAYLVPAGLLNKGDNVVLVRIHDQMYSGGFRGIKDDMFLKHGAIDVNLAGEWKFAVSDLEYEPSPPDNATASVLYNAMIHPLVNYNIKGVLWYQGESNANSLEDAKNYGVQLRNLVIDWRKKWNQRDLPFLVVQLPNYQTPASRRGEGEFWPFLRQSQSNLLTEPNTAVAVTIDLGDPNDIHPLNKKDFGYRLALEAQRVVYGRGVLSSGPKYLYHQFDEGRVELILDSVGDGLKVENRFGILTGFEVIDARGNSYYPRAEISEREKVTIWLDNIEQPLYLRYAWSDNPVDANLYNKMGLPMAPFNIKL